jgi:hypothetical protein
VLSLLAAVVGEVVGFFTNNSTGKETRAPFGTTPAAGSPQWEAMQPMNHPFVQLNVVKRQSSCRHGLQGLRTHALQRQEKHYDIVPSPSLCSSPPEGPVAAQLDLAELHIPRRPRSGRQAAGQVPQDGRAHSPSLQLPSGYVARRVADTR